MKVLIYGYRGWIASHFIRCIRDMKPHWEIMEGESRVENVQDVMTELAIKSPNRVLACIGRTHGLGTPTIDYLEPKELNQVMPLLQENVKDNLFAPVALAILCQKFGIHFTYLGTGCIFKYDDKHPYGESDAGFSESDDPNFFGSSYSIVKGYTDQLMRLFGSNTLNLRIRMPISADKSSRNFITKITHYEKICSVPNSMTVLEELIPLAIDMMINKQTGTINMTNPGLITHNEILEMYRDIVDPSFEWSNFTVEEQRSILLADRSNNCLNTSGLQMLYPQVSDIHTAVKKTLIKMAKNE